jgi:hypothetical protein
VTVFNLGSDWGISQVYPQRAGTFEPVNPQLSIELPFEAYLPEGVVKDTGQFKIFATRATTSFRWLELPPLDKPDTRSAASRSAVTDPLEQMLVQITGDAITTRALRLTSERKDVGWTVAQVEFHVEK